MAATHAEVSQVGDGELKGNYIKQLIEASILGTENETRFTVEGVWRKVQKVFPESLQAVTKLMVEDARAQWTTQDNLKQWFDDAKQDLIKTGLEIDYEVLDEEGAMLSEVVLDPPSRPNSNSLDQQSNKHLKVNGLILLLLLVLE
jgi:hypothetical protein